MHWVLAALFYFAILMLWVPAYWPVSVFQAGVFALAAGAVVRGARAPTRLPYPLFALGFAVAWGLFQWATGRTAYGFDTRNDVVQWATYSGRLLHGLYPVSRPLRAPPVSFLHGLVQLLRGGPGHSADIHLRRQGILAVSQRLHRFRDGPHRLSQPLCRLHRSRPAHCGL